MRRRALLAGVVGAAGLVPGAARAQPSGRIYRVGYLWLGREGGDAVVLQELREGLLALGYVEGRNLALELRHAVEPAGLPALATELVALRVDLLRTIGTAATRAAQHATATIPIVATVGDMVGAGFAASLARPGGNITGVALSPGPELLGKRVELLRNVVPDLRRVAHLWASESPPTGEELVRLSRDIAAIGVGAESFALRAADHASFERALTLARQAQCGGALVESSPPLDGEREALVAAINRHRMPAIYPRPEYAVAGGLLSYAPDLTEINRRVAMITDRVLRGARPADIPVEEPAKFQLVVNLRTAAALGFTIPPAILAGADEVIE